MGRRNIPEQHKDPWLDLLRPYVTQTVLGLQAAGLDVREAWLDPYDPRDATVVLANSEALVFDEVTGWRYGRFLAGQPGVRTALDDVRYVGGGVLPNAGELAHRVINGISVPRRDYRSVTDLHDGLDDALRAQVA